jgi:hypothetical protein
VGVDLDPPDRQQPVRQIIDPGSSMTWIGWGSKSHKYPAQQRFNDLRTQVNSFRCAEPVSSTPANSGRPRTGRSTPSRAAA